MEAIHTRLPDDSESSESEAGTGDASPSKIKFSTSLGLTRQPEYDWFDPVLTTDTQLFVDPFLIFLDEDETWEDAHDKVIDHFDRAFQLLAQTSGNPHHPRYQAALNLLQFPEPSEFCLGYTARGTRGSGSGKQGASRIAEAMSDAIARGVQHLEHFEELGILNEGIGPDRISDIVCTVLKPDFVTYTQQVAQGLDIPMKKHRLRAAGFDSSRAAAAQTQRVHLPTNPKTGGPLLLTPTRFLRDLPVLNAENWWVSDEARQLRRELDLELITNVRKKDIVALARRNPESVTAWTKRMERQGADPYDLEADPRGIYAWADDTTRYVKRNPLAIEPPTTDVEFAAVIQLIVDKYKHYIEERGGWKLLWNDDSNEKHEEAAQLAFQGIAASYCEANNIVVDREVELGRGAVDFKFSNGYRNRTLLEIKKLHNGKFWNGVEAQLPTYLGADNCTDGWFVAVRYKTKGVSAKRARTLPRKVQQMATQSGFDLRQIVVDARPKSSASRTKATGPALV